MSDVSIPENLPDWIKDHIQRYLASDGEDGHLWDSSIAGGPGPIPTLLLTTTGRRSGQPRILPLIYGERDDGYAIIASKGGAPSHPSWYLNLLENPEVHIQVGAKKTKALARTAEGEERSEIWKQLRAIYPPYDDYQAKTERQIPVVVLEPISD